MSQPESLKMVLFFDAQADVWVGSFLEYFIVAQGITWQAALRETQLAIVQQAELDDRFETTPLANFCPAPQDIIDRFENPAARQIPAWYGGPLNVTSRFVDRYLKNLIVKRLDL